MKRLAPGPFLALLLLGSSTNAQAPLVPWARPAAMPAAFAPPRISALPAAAVARDVLSLEGRFRLPFHWRHRPLVSWEGQFGAHRQYGWHSGVDFIVPLRTPVYAARTGRVVRLERYDRQTASGRGYGGLVVLEHIDGSQSWYAHLDRVFVRQGQIVPRGARLGLSGGRNNGHSSGPHLHFMILRKTGEAINPDIVLTRGS